MGVLLQNDHPVGGISADVIEDINFDLTTNAKNLPGAINELNGKSSTTVSVTQAEYDALPSSKLTDDIAYYIKDGVPDVDNALWNKVGTATLETTSKDCSGAINELNSSLNSKITLKEFHSANVTLYTDTDYTDYHYIFTQTYTSTPRVILDLFTATTTRNNIPIAVIQALSLTSVIVRVWKQVGVANTSTHTAMATPQLNIAVFGN